MSVAPKSSSSAPVHPSPSSLPPLSSYFSGVNLFSAVSALALGLAAIKGVQYYSQNYSDGAANKFTIGSNKETNPYETKQLLYEYLLMHYGRPDQLLIHQNIPDPPTAALSFPLVCAQQCIQLLQSSSSPVLSSPVRVLDLGCAVGRSSFELARFSTNVVGIDYSQSFVDACNELKLKGSTDYSYKTEGDLTQNGVAVVDESIDRSRVHFQQGDACNLSVSELGQFGLILGANLLCRLPYPRRFLSSLASLVVPGGFVVLYSPYTWLEAYTHKSEWIGGYICPKTGKPVSSADGLKKIMEGERGEGNWKLVLEKNVPFYIRETARKNQWTVSHLTVWKRK